jgi:polar amino acid transport system substrate-binding protein
MPLARLISLFLLACILAVVAGCGDDDDDSAEEGTTTTAEASAATCTATELETLKPDTLTVATDSPAFPPYFVDDDPTNGKGFESAVAYAIANELGFTRDQVEWVVEPFNRSFAPGPKEFDFDVNQISITEKRAEAVDFSSPYYTANQAVVALQGTDAASATSLADLADTQFGVQIGTTSLDAVEQSIQPNSDPQVFDTSNDVVSALKQEQVEAVVVDVPTAFFLTAVQVPEGTIVGQFSAPGGDEWGALLEKDSPLTDCVSFAIDSMRESGVLADIEQTWISEKADAPILE